METRLKCKRLVAGVEKPVSQLALGTGLCRLEEKAAWFELFDEFVERGGNMLDTARHYSTSEDVIGLWMEARGNRERIVITTKGGHSDVGDLVADDFEGVVGREIEQSLEALRTSVIDLYLLHRDNVRLPVGRILDFLNEQLQTGRIRAFGLSNWEYRRLDEANEYADTHGLVRFAVVSNGLALAVPAQAFFPGLVSVDRDGERWHARTKTPLLPWSSQARGFFTGRYRPELRAAAGREGMDWTTARMLEVYGTDENFERLRRAEALGREKGGYTAVEIALAWVLHRPIAVVPVVGPRTVGEVASCVKAAGIELTASEMNWLNLES